MTDYNYSTFDLAREQGPFEAFRTKLHVGERAASHPVEDLPTGESVPLSQLWANGPAVLEFGSLT